MRRRAGLATIVLVAAGLIASAAPSSRLALPASPLSEQERVLHVLNRLGYGPRPTDVARVREMGVAVYLEQQLDPSRPPSAALNAALAGYDVLSASTAQLVRDYPQPTAELRQRVAQGDMTRRELRELIPAGRRPAAITGQLQAAAVTRAVVSEAQLEEALAAFWFNHFNVYSQKGAVRWMVPAYEREAIRPHVLGNFRDLVLATARHPAMLFYLDNWMSTRADPVMPRGRNSPASARPRPAGRSRGLNENYARELMELHTLGVDGGYTQQDVTEVARAFTGWTIDRPREGGSFLFRPGVHDQGSKRVLGQMIPAGGGERDGERVIDILVRHPSTARFISTKLARHFVMDDPPVALVDRMAATFRSSDGDIRAVMTTLVTSPEFWSREAYRAKIKTPFEVVVSAVRALDGRLETGRGRAAGRAAGGGAAELAREVGRLGQPLYEAQPPTGYPDRAESWVNTGALLGRMNFALALAHNRFRDAPVDLGAVIGSVDRAQPSQVLDRVLAVVLQGAATPQTRAVLTAQLESPEITRTTGDDRVASDTDVEKLAALVLGSPEFQRR
ncbi:MAG TPA: DUF1800 domain-containing protein [Vicinamibacterales bacterium]|nr:DUF1800 domain-containing protein [Vicinamibacterales bacterium]